MTEIRGKGLLVGNKRTGRSFGLRALFGTDQSLPHRVKKVPTAKLAIDRPFPVDKFGPIQFRMPVMGRTK
jgi:hypothetical protein